MASEAELIAAAIATGDRRAFGALVAMHQGGLRRVIARWTGGDRALADDIAQEAFVRAYRGMGGFRGEARFFSWLCRIGYHAFVEHRRRRMTDSGTTPTDEAAPAAPLDLRHDLERALKRLSDDERVAVGLCLQAELTHEEASRVMDVPLGTLKSHVSRARVKLAEFLKAWRKEED